MKKLVFVIVLAVVVFLTGWIILKGRSMPSSINYTQFVQQVESGQVEAVKIESGE